MLLYRRHIRGVETEITRNKELYIIGDGRIYDFGLGHRRQSTHRGYNCILALAGLSKRSFWIVCLEDFDVWEGAVDRVVSGEEADCELCGEEMLDDDWTNVTFRLSIVSYLISGWTRYIVTYSNDQDVLDGGHVESAVFGGGGDNRVKLWKIDFLFRNFVRWCPYISLVDPSFSVEWVLVA